MSERPAFRTSGRQAMTSTKNPKTRAVVFSSNTDDWPTPKALFDELDDEFGFSLDVCASSTTRPALRPVGATLSRISYSRGMPRPRNPATTK